MANNEWGTPPQIIEAARRAMGSIDLDPASNLRAQQTVRADTYYTKHTDGLTQEWVGNVWLNPPFGRGEPAPFLTKLVKSYREGQVTQAVVLVNSVYTSLWWDSTGIKDAYRALVLPHRRINFMCPSRLVPIRGNSHDQIIVYLGDNPARFCEAFGQIGVGHVRYTQHPTWI